MKRSSKDKYKAKRPYYFIAIIVILILQFIGMTGVYANYSEQLNKIMFYGLLILALIISFRMLYLDEKKH